MGLLICPNGSHASLLTYIPDDTQLTNRLAAIYLSEKVF